MSFPLAEELVQLRRLDRGPAQHCVRLAAVVDLVFEEMQQQPDGALALDSLAPVYLHNVVQRRLGQLVAGRYQPPVHISLSHGKLSHDSAGKRVGPGAGAKVAALDGIDIEPVDYEIVIERGLDRTEEASPGRLELALGQGAADGQEPMIGPGVVVGHGAKSLNERSRHDGLRAAGVETTDAL